jgi:hypothetical protein
MAQIIAAFHIETDLVHDCVADLVRVHMALTHRHGHRFRRLERRIEELEEAPAPKMTYERLEAGRWVMLPPTEWTGLIAEARALGVT